MKQKAIIEKLGKKDLLLLSLAFLIVIVTPMASDSYTPSLPAMAHYFHSSSDAMQLTMTFYLFGVSVSQLIYGPLSDRFGRRPIILVGLTITVIGSLFCAFSNTLNLILIARLIQGSGAGVCNALFRALLRDLYTGFKMSQVGSYAGMVYTIAFAGAPVIGGHIQTWFGWRANFIFLALLALIILILIWTLLPETHHKRDANATKLKNILKNYIFLLTSPAFVGYTTISSLAYSGFVAYYTAAPFLLEKRVGLTPVEFGWLSLGIAIGLFLGMIINVRLVVSKGVSYMLLVGIWIMLISGVSMLVPGMLGILNTYVVIIPVIFFALASGLVFANAMTNAFYHVGHIAGIAGGMYGFIQVFGSSLISIIIVRLHEKTQVPLGSVLTGLSVTAFILFIILRRLPSNGGQVHT